MNDKKFIQGLFVGIMLTAMVGIAVIFSGCAIMQSDIPTDKAIEHSVLRLHNTAAETYKMYMVDMTEDQREEALGAINHVYTMLQAYKAMKGAVTNEDTMELIKAKDHMIDVISELTGVEL